MKKRMVIISVSSTGKSAYASVDTDLGNGIYARCASGNVSISGGAVKIGDTAVLPATCVVSVQLRENKTNGTMVPWLVIQ